MIDNFSEKSVNAFKMFLQSLIWYPLYLQISWCPFSQFNLSTFKVRELYILILKKLLNSIKIEFVINIKIKDIMYILYAYVCVCIKYNVTDWIYVYKRKLKTQVHRTMARRHESVWYMSPILKSFILIDLYTCAIYSTVQWTKKLKNYAA